MSLDLKGMRFDATGVRVVMPSHRGYGRSPSRMYACQDGYNLSVHKLDYGMVHALFWSKSERFMRVLSPEALWNELNDTRFTTPVIEEWAPYIVSKLIESWKLRECYCFQCECGELLAETKDLDAIVSAGLKSGAIAIPKQENDGL